MNIKQYFCIILPFFIFGIANSIIPKNQNNHGSPKILLPDKYAKLLSFGQNELIGGALWINLIQRSNTKKDNDIFEFNRAMYISNLSPYFYSNYKINSLTISIVKDQFEQSNILIKKGLKYFSNDYELLFQHGFNSFFLLDRKEEGIKYFDKIYHKNLYKGENEYFPIIYSNVQKKIGHKEISKKILYDLYQKTDDQKLKKALLKKLR